jgi:hypothetical protein
LAASTVRRRGRSGHAATPDLKSGLAQDALATLGDGASFA